LLVKRFDLIEYNFKIKHMLAAHRTAKSQLVHTMESQNPMAADVWNKITLPISSFLSTAFNQLQDQINAFEPEISPFALHALRSHGKQIRSALLAFSGSIFSKLSNDHIKAAVIIEMVHLATLVHDDIMDNASIRRGLPTLPVSYGTDVSVLLGDSLFAHALVLASEFRTTHVCRAVSEATKAVCTGEIIQTLANKNKLCDLPQYLKTLKMKTGSLFALACELGAWLANGSKAQCSKLKHFGSHLGIAYQAYDDCLDIYGTESSSLKSLGTDLETGKFTLPILVAFEKATNQDKENFLNLIHSQHPEKHRQIMAFLSKYNALNESKKIIKNIICDAVDCLKSIPDSEGKERLIMATSFIDTQIESL